VRNAARRAGVAPATAYTYFSSKDHLVTEVYWRLVRGLPPARVDRRRSPAARATAALAEVALLLAGEPEVAAAATTAVLANDPDVRRMRDVIGAQVYERVAIALGADADARVLRALLLAFSGAMLQAGMGYFGYDQLADRVSEVASLVCGGGGAA
jgi:AcrR family transcriptional regulator